MLGHRPALLIGLMLEALLGANPDVGRWPQGTGDRVVYAQNTGTPPSLACPLTRSDRMAIVLELACSGTDAAHALLARWLDDPDLDARLLAAHALVRAGNTPALERVTTWLDTGSPELLAGALAIVRAAPDLPEKLIGRLADLFTHQQGTVRLAAWRALEERGVRLAAPRALSLLQDELAELRIAGLRILARSNNKQATALVLERLVDSDERVRGAAAHALATLGDERAVPGLVRALSLPGPSARAACLTALGALGGTQAVTTLSAHTQAPDGESVARAALLALAAIVARGGPDAELALAALLDRFERLSGDGPGQRAVDLALQQAGPLAVRALARRLHRAHDFSAGAEAADRDARIVAIFADIFAPSSSAADSPRGTLGDNDQEYTTAPKPAVLEDAARREAVEALTELLPTSSSVVPQVITLLGRMRALSAIPELGLLATSIPSPGLRRLALRALTTIIGPRPTDLTLPIVSAVFVNLDHPLPAVRAAAFDLLGATGQVPGAWGAGDLRRIFEAALVDPEQEVVCAALSAAAKLQAQAPRESTPLRFTSLADRLASFVHRGLGPCLQAVLPRLASMQDAPHLARIALGRAASPELCRLALATLAALASRDLTREPARRVHLDLRPEQIDSLIHKLAGDTAKDVAPVLVHQHLSHPLAPDKLAEIARLYPGLPPAAQLQLVRLLRDSTPFAITARHLARDDRTFWPVRRALARELSTKGVSIDFPTGFFPVSLD